MNHQKIIDELKQRYPGKRILVNDKYNPTEIVCEIDPADNDHTSKSVAVAVIDETIEHTHGETIELYEVLRGQLLVKKDGKKYKLKAGESIAIRPGEYHVTEGNGTWIKVVSTPGLAMKNHIVVVDGKK